MFTEELKRSLTTHKAVIWGLLNREITTRFGDSYFGYAWLIIEPMFTLGVFYTMFYLLDKTTGNISILLFLLTGIVPFFYFRKLLSSSTAAISANQALLSYKQVKVIDTIVSRIVLETAISFATAIICALLIIYLGDESTVYYPLRIIVVVFLLICISTGTSLFVAIISYYYLDLGKFMGVVNRILFFTSGVFFSLNDFPPDIAYYLSFNPILQIIELIRSAFSLEHISILLSYEYTFIFTLTMFFLGLASYFVARKNIMMNSRAR